MAFLRLIRLPNLLFVALTQYLLRYFLMAPIFSIYNVNFTLDDLEFSLLVLSTVLITAAGYMINDYFDVAIDAVNKPRRLLVGYEFKRRTVIALHLLFNAVGIGLGIYLGMQLGNYKLGFIHFIAASLLWYYSTAFKKQFLIGNLIVSLLTALVIMLVGFYELILYEALSTNTREATKAVITLMLAYAFFAFMISMVREIVKDLQDREGDMQYGSRTLPIVWGVSSAKRVLTGLIIVLMLSIAYVEWLQLVNTEYAPFIYTAALIQLPLFYILFKLKDARSPEDFGKISNWVKGVMLMGILSMVYFYALIKFG